MQSNQQSNSPDSTTPKAIQVGHLIMASNSLGNNLDIPQRSLDAVKNSDIVIFEEDRVARQVLKTAGIHREYLKFNEHAQKDTLDEVRNALKKNQTITYMSDQGCPTIEDPGSAVLEIAYSLKSKVTVIPGPCSISAALSACPFATHGYLFAGFLPREQVDRVKKLKDLSSLRVPLVIMDTPYRLHALIDSCMDVFGKGRKVLLAIDISGEQERFICDNLENCKKLCLSMQDKLNFVLVVASS
ncbi:MAG: SAM-dependent methyltransferase [Proteobacteria bacterium]|nr:SAM-dependent methyltransferase [Pseudomonadota bacterium]